MIKKLSLLILPLVFILSSNAQPVAVISLFSNCQEVEYYGNNTCTGCTITGWSWDFGDGSVSALQNPTHLYSSSGTYTVTLTVTDNLGNTDVDQQVLSVAPSNNLSITISAPNPCFTDECRLVTATASGGTPPYTYFWSSYGFGSTQQTAEFCEDMYWVDTVWFQVTDANGCTAENLFGITSAFITHRSSSPEVCNQSNGTAGITVTGTNDPLTYLWSPGGETTPSISGLSQGDYTVVASDTSGCQGTNVFHIVDSCGYISGNVFTDENANNVFDTGEDTFPYGTINSTGNFVYQSLLTNNGAFSNQVGGGNFITNFIPFNNYYTVSPVNHPSTINLTSSTDNVDFAVVPIPGNPDLRIVINTVHPAVLGTYVAFYVYATNVGTETLTGSVKFVKDNLVSIQTLTPWYDNISADTLIWDFTNLAPLDGMIFYLSFSVPPPPTLSIGDSLYFSGSIEPVSGDVYPQDNYAVAEERVLSSYDPNDKWVSRDTLLPWEIASEEYLYYRIRFQNTGTYAAINILVRDTLDEKLDWNTLQTISSSHSYNISVTNGNAVEWTFSNIMLPDSNANEPESHGFIYYRIRHKNTLNIGDNISNTAAIFFDYNEPVITNTVTTTVAHTTSVNDTKYEFVRIFPNPATNRLVIETAFTKGFYQVFDITGKTLLEGKVNATKFNLDISSFSSGVYFISVSDGERQVFGKLVKE